MGNKAVSILFILLFLVVLGSVYHLNILYPCFADDITYSFIMERNGELKVRIASFSDIIQSQYNHYLIWGGRSVVHIIAQGLQWIDHSVSDVLNTLVYLIMVTYIYVFATNKKSLNVGLFIIINLVLWFILPAFTETVLWLTGSANYTWGMCIVLIFLHQYYRLFWSENSSQSKLKNILFFVGGIIAGWTNENIALAMIFLICASLLYLYFNKKQVPIWVISGLVGACVGCVFMLLAPGNYVRAAMLSHNIGLDEVSQFKLFKVRLYNILAYGWKPFLIAGVSWLAFYTLYCCYGNQENRKKTLLASIAFFGAAILGYAVLFPIAIIPDRAFYGISVFILISVGILYANIEWKTLWLKAGNVLLILLLFFFFVQNFIPKYNELKTFSEISKERTRVLNAHKERGEQDVIFEEGAIYPVNREYLFVDPTHPYNKYYSLYQGIGSIRLAYQP